jgi:hypothetical protein
LVEPRLKELICEVMQLFENCQLPARGSIQFSRLLGIIYFEKINTRIFKSVGTIINVITIFNLFLLFFSIFICSGPKSNSTQGHNFKNHSLISNAKKKPANQFKQIIKIIYK